MADVLAVLSLGLLTGWLVNYAADVLPSPGRRLRPHCWSCQKALPWIAYIRLDVCPACGRRRRFRTCLLQPAILAGILYLWRTRLGQLEFPWSTLLFSYLLLIAVVDIEHHLILHATSIVGILMGLVIGIHMHGVQATVTGGVAGYGIMFLLYISGAAFVRCLSRWRGHSTDEVALGYGDVIFAGIAGLLLGWPGILQGLLIAMLAAGVVSIIIVTRMLVRNQYQDFLAVPYGSFLALSVFCLFLRP